MLGVHGFILVLWVVGVPLAGRGLLAYWVGGVTPARFDVLRRHGLAVHA